MSTYKMIYSVPDVETYLNLRVSAGMSPKTPEAAAVGLANSLFAVQVTPASSPETTIGMGRIIGDGGCFFQIVDIAVLPSHQGRGVGKMIMKNIRMWMDENVPESGMVSLFADGKANELYKQFGFVETSTWPVPSIGMALVYTKDGQGRQETSTEKT